MAMNLIQFQAGLSMPEFLKDFGSLEQGNSAEHPQIQIADLCAGAINHFLKCQEAGEMDDLAILIHDLCCFDWAINGVFPNPEVTPKDLGTDSEDGVNPVDSMVAYLRQR